MNGTTDPIDELRQLRTCGICENICCDPRSLECLHSFCLDCLKETLVANADNVACPTCNIEIILTAGSSVDDFLSSLQPNVICSETGLFDMHINDIVGCRKHPNYECSYFYTDSLEFACDVCRHENPENCDVITPDIVAEIRSERHEGAKNTVSVTKDELTDICEKLRSREKTVLTNNDGVVLGVMKYFIDLRTQINEYLSKHEKDVLNKLKDLTEKEMSNTVMSMKYCMSLLKSINSTFSRLLKPITFSSGNGVRDIQLFEILQLHAEEYLAKAKSIKQSRLNETETRFIINTEFEDVLTTGDLIDIEVVNQSDYSASESTESQISSSQNTLENVINVETQANAPRNAEISITVTPPQESPMDESNDDPPPPYPGFQNMTETSNEQQQFSFETVPRLPSAPTETSQVLPSAPIETPRVIPPRETTSVLPSVLNHDVSTAPVVPRGLTHGSDYEPVSPLGVSRDSHKLGLLPLWKFRLVVPGQLNNPNLVDLSWIDDKTLLALDKKNSLMSVVSNKGYYCSSYNFHGDPYSCAVYSHPVYSGIYVAVTFPKEKKLMLCKLNEMFNFRVKSQPLIRQTNKGYTYIRFDQTNHNFICCSSSPFSLPCVDLLDNDGVFLKSFNGSEITRLGYPRAVQIDDRETIVISDYKTSSVLLMSTNGRQRGVFKGGEGRKLNDPQGIGFSKELGLFVVADTRGNRLFFIDSRGFSYDSFSESSLLGNTPRFVEFSTSFNPTLAIGHGNGYISMYKVIKSGVEQTSV